MISFTMIELYVFLPFFPLQTVNEEKGTGGELKKSRTTWSTTKIGFVVL